VRPIFVLDFAEIRQQRVNRHHERDASVRAVLHAVGADGQDALDGFALTTDAYKQLLATGHLAARLRRILAGVDANDPVGLARRGREARAAVLDTALPDDLRDIILSGYQRLCRRLGGKCALAVYASSTHELMPTSPDSLLRAVQHCYASIFVDDAIADRAAIGLDQLSVGVSIGIIPRMDQTRRAAA
jgi:pyruvate,water dikinase